mmetsp:Transcript_6570/g.8919  ORF Transcript_6570/g.8919 Transcript_6570/m.8919 type:complete len:335 (-) Transcript_6570:255-1259(-)
MGQVHVLLGADLDRAFAHGGALGGNLLVMLRVLARADGLLLLLLGRGRRASHNRCLLLDTTLRGLFGDLLGLLLGVLDQLSGLLLSLLEGGLLGGLGLLDGGVLLGVLHLDVLGLDGGLLVDLGDLGLGLTGRGLTSGLNFGLFDGSLLFGIGGLLRSLSLDLGSLDLGLVQLLLALGRSLTLDHAVPGGLGLGVLCLLLLGLAGGLPSLNLLLELEVLLLNLILHGLALGLGIVLLLLLLGFLALLLASLAGLLHVFGAGLLDGLLDWLRGLGRGLLRRRLSLGVFCGLVGLLGNLCDWLLAIATSTDLLDGGGLSTTSLALALALGDLFRLG